jgi:hypothetical protein
MDALAPAEVKEVIALRRTTFVALDAGVDRVLRSVEHALAGAAQARAGAAAERAMALLGRWYGKRRYEGFGAAALLGRLVPREVRLARELQDAGRADEGAAREAAARALAEELAHAGQPEFARALPYVALERVVRMTPGDPMLADLLTHAHEPLLNWRGSLVVPLGTRDLPDLRAAGRTVDILWPARDGLIELLEGTPAQVDRDLAKQVARARDLRPIQAAFLARLAVEQLAFKRWSEASLAGQPAARVLTKQIADESPRLLAELAALPPADPARTLEAARADATFLGALARAAGRETRVADLVQLAAELSSTEKR